MDFFTDTRGFRNNNPGNIKKGDQWRGLADEQKDDVFCTFKSLEFGIRAIFKILHTYNIKYKSIKIKDIISRWAPRKENNTASYIDSVCQHIEYLMYYHDKIFKKPPIMSICENYIIKDLEQPLIVASIIRHENGFNPFSIEFIRKCKTDNYITNVKLN